MTTISRNMAFLRALYTGAPVTRHAFLARPPDSPNFGGLGDHTLSDRPIGPWVDWAVSTYENRVRFLEQAGGDGVPLVPMLTATHIYAAAFGCRVADMQDSLPMALSCVHNADAADRLREPSVWSSPSLVRTFELARGVQERLGKDVPISVPDMQSGFDIACQIWDKADLYCAIMDDAQRHAVERLAAKCSRLLNGFLTAWRAEFPASSPNHCPGGWCPPELGPWVSNDECGAMNVATFETFCLPELVAMSEMFGGLGMHCCANAEHQFPSFRRIPNFYAFNRVESRRGYQPALDILGGPGGPVMTLAWVPEDTLAGLIRTAPKGTRFVLDVGDGTVDGARASIERLRTVTPNL